MPDPRTNMPDELLENATAALRNSAVPDGPPADLVTRTVAALQAAQVSRRSPKLAFLHALTRRITATRPLVRLATAAALAIAVGAILFWGLGQRGLAFAQVLQQLMTVRTVKYNLAITAPMPQALQTVTYECTVADRYHMRWVASDGSVIVGDLSQGFGHMLFLRPQMKLALLADSKRNGVDVTEPGHRNLLDWLTRLDESSARSLGYKEIDGRMAAGFEAYPRGRPESGRQEVWVDPQTRLPVRIELGSRPGQTPYVNWLMTDFQWNVPVDPSLVDMTPPPGYRVLKANLSRITEADLIDSLKTAAELCGGSFPARLTFKAVLRDRGLYQDRLGIPVWIQAVQWLGLTQRVADAARGVCFAMDPSNGDDWHYAGADVLLDQPDTPIFWYRPKDSTSYRVIYADLTVQDVPPENLPQVPSVPVEPWWGTTASQPSTPATPAQPTP